MKPAYTKGSILSNIFIGLVIITVIAYNAYRAYFMSFTHDESVSYLLFKLFNVKVIHLEHIQNVTHLDLELNRITHAFSANNHILNTMLMKICSVLLGDKEWALRLPNVLAHFAYLYYTLKILSLQKNKLISTCGFIVLNLNPFILDFFSIARGYGLALSLMMGSLYYFIKAIEHTKGYFLAYSICFLAVYANFTLFNYYLCMIFCNICITLISLNKFSWQSVKTLIRKNTTLIIVNIAFFLVTVLVLSVLNSNKQFYVGADTIWDALQSFNLSALYNNIHMLAVAKGLSALTILSIVVFITLVLKNLKSKTINSFSILAIIFISCIILILIEYWFFKMPLPEGRTGLYLFSLFFLILFFALQNFTNRYSSKIIFTIPILLAVFSVCNFGINANLKSVLYMAYDANSKHVYAQIERDAHGKEANIYTDWLFEPSLNYYRVSRKSLNIQPVLKQLPISEFRPDSISDNYNYYYLHSYQIQPGRNPQLLSVARYRDTHTVLLKR